MATPINVARALTMASAVNRVNVVNIAIAVIMASAVNVDRVVNMASSVGGVTQTFGEFDH